MLQISQQWNRLQRFAETHLISKDSIDAVLIEGNHPVQTADLIISHLSALDVGGRCLEAENSLWVCFLSQQFLILFLFGFSVAMTEIKLIKHLELQAPDLSRQCDILSCRRWWFHYFLLLFRTTNWFALRRALGACVRHEMSEDFCLFEEIIEALAAVCLNLRVEFHFLFRRWIRFLITAAFTLWIQTNRIEVSERETRCKPASAAGREHKAVTHPSGDSCFVCYKFYSPYFR